jgi:transposase
VIHYLPKYAPETNPIERLWWHLHEAIPRIIGVAAWRNCCIWCPSGWATKLLTRLKVPSTPNLQLLDLLSLLCGVI